MKTFLKYFTNCSILFGLIAFFIAFVLLASYLDGIFNVHASVWRNPPFEFFPASPFLIIGATAVGFIGMTCSSVGAIAANMYPFKFVLLGIGIAYCLLIGVADIYPAVMSQRNILDAFPGIIIFYLPGIGSIIISLAIRKPKTTKSEVKVDKAG